MSDNLEEIVSGPAKAMKLTARQGAAIRMPDGRSIGKAFRGLAEQQAQIFATTVQDGLLSGESTQSIARTLIGEGLEFSTKAKSIRQLAQAGGQMTKMATHQVRTLVRTSVNATSNVASQRVYKANPTVTKKYRWLATLDEKTSPICRSLDQQVFEYGKGPTPANPPHFNCRSSTVPVVDWDGLSNKYGIDLTPPRSRAKRPSASGGVPLGTSYGKWLHDQRPKGKKFEASAAQAKALNGGRDTPGARQKARYFNRLADKYGPDKAMKKFLRDDGTEVSLADLKKRYGEPERITATKTKAKPKAAAKPKPTPKPKPAEEPTPALKPISSAGFKKAYQGKGQLNLAEVYEQQGFNAKAEMVKDMDQLLARKDLIKDVDGQDNLVFFRGIPEQSSVDQWQGRGSQGGIHYAGKGVYGNGSYMAAAGQSGKWSVANAHYTATSYSGDKASLVTASGLKKDARIWRTSIPVPKDNPALDRAANNKARIAARMEAHNEWEKWSLGIIKEAKEKFGEDLNDIGEAAAALGYDGYQVPMANHGRGGSEDYWVILNRGSLVSIEGPSPMPATRFDGDKVVFEAWTKD